MVEARYRKSLLEYERYTLLAVSSLYGIDILLDNVLECRQRLLALVDRYFRVFFRDDFLRTVRFVIERNIIWGDALSLQTVGDHPQPIVFSEWSFVNGSMVKRRDFAFHELLAGAKSSKERQLSFSDLGDEVFLPEPLKEYPLTHYLMLADAEGA